MQFLSPHLFWGLLALLIPIAVHLFNFRRHKTVLFSNTKFLKLLEQQTKTGSQLKHFLVLASRLLFIFFLVLAFTEPFLPASEGDKDRGPVYFYLDNSPSMSNEFSLEKTLKEEGIDRILQISQSYPINTRFKLINNDFLQSSPAFRSGTELEEMLTELRYTPFQKSFSDIENRVAKDERVGRDLVKELFIVSDFQAYAFENLNEWIPDSSINYHFLPISPNQAQNIFVDTVFLENKYLLPGNANPLQIVIKNTGLDDVKDLSIRLTINGVQFATTALDVPAQSKGEVVVNLETLQDPINECVISFEDYPIIFDNDFYFTIVRDSKFKINELRLAGLKSPFSALFGNEDLFDFNSFEDNNVDFQALFSADLVIINGIESFDDRILGKLRTFAQEGGTLFLIPSSENSSSSAFSGLVGMPISEETMEEKLDLALPDRQNPFFDGMFENKDDRFQMPIARPVIRMGGRSNALLSFNNGLPFLSKNDIGIYVMASPLFRDYTDIANHAIFLPIMYRIAAQSKQLEEKLYHRMDDRNFNVAIGSFTSTAGSEPYRLRKDDLEVIPEQYPGRDYLVLRPESEFLSAGFFRLYLKDEQIGSLAINHSKKESELKMIELEELAILADRHERVFFEQFNSASETAASFQARMQGLPLWKYPFIVALLFLLVEILILKFWRK
ncbi:MAG: BatA domain-containing protein [Cyclobacteriaceae bacterium]|nr:BatA domain-containing protein [Cyclobacteriaceae bacterium]MCH8516729.1 BatA domain-containing protein [Cyclobacteriaceae bacterium]